jgi:hypothetical protein
MPDYSTLSNVTQSRASTSDVNTVETQNGFVTSVQLDAAGNVTSANVRVYGQANDIISVPNATSQKLFTGAVVVVNNVNQSRQGYKITGFGSAGTSSAAVAAATTVPTGITPGSNGSGNTDPVVIWETDSSLINALLAIAGANISLEVSYQSQGSGLFQNNNGFLTINMLVHVYYGTSAAALPTAATCGLPDGTLADVVNPASGENIPIGMFRLVGNGAGAYWQQRNPTGGTVNFNQQCTGSGTAWVLPFAPANGVALFADGAALNPLNDYTISGGVNITLTNAALNWVMGIIQ